MMHEDGHEGGVDDVNDNNYVDDDGGGVGDGGDEIIMRKEIPLNNGGEQRCPEANHIRYMLLKSIYYREYERIEKVAYVMIMNIIALSYHTNKNVNIKMMMMMIPENVCTSDSV